LNFLNIAAGSATEARYLADVSRRLGYLREGDGAELVTRYTELAARLQALIASLADP
jgi:four helix bundle protein